MYDDLYCKVYLNSKSEIEELCQQINCVVLGRIEPIRTIITDWGEIDLRKNSDFNPKMLENDPEDFIFWQYYLDIEPKKNVDQFSYIAQIAKLLEQLNLVNIKCVASCDFEEEL